MTFVLEDLLPSSFCAERGTQRGDDLCCDDLQKIVVLWQMLQDLKINCSDVFFLNHLLPLFALEHSHHVYNACVSPT